MVKSIWKFSSRKFYQDDPDHLGKEKVIISFSFTLHDAMNKHLCFVTMLLTWQISQI